MANKYLAREDAPFGESLWKLLDERMISTAKICLVGRKLLDLEGPYGLGLKSLPLGDERTEAGPIIGRSQPVPLLQERFTLWARDLAAYERDGVLLDTQSLEEAVLALAQAEDRLIFNGVAGQPGLTTASGVGEITLQSWEETGMAATDIIHAVTSLDQAGFHGPYAVALSPDRYNLLYRMYPRGQRSELQHIQTIAAGGVVKAPTIDSGGVVIAPERRSATLVVGQDMTVGFIGPDAEQVEFFVSESLALRLRHPASVCVLKA
jgi:uncharacterized linocin/CFP29 family protein